MSKPQRPHMPENRILKSLPQCEYDRLLPDLELVELPQGKILYESYDQINFIYFPNDAAVSLLSVSETGATVEIGLIGSEGIVGFAVALKRAKIPFSAMVQIPGNGYRISSTAFRPALEKSQTFYDLILNYTYGLIVQISQSALCNRFHTIEARLSRWLLLSHDRVKTDTLPYTQELLASMVGSMRSDITRAAKVLQQAGLINYSRGRITIIDRQGLENYSCECYKIVKDEFDGFLKS
jgi:CRP-like cAMP-binding protein